MIVLMLLLQLRLWLLLRLNRRSHQIKFLMAFEAIRVLSDFFGQVGGLLQLCAALVRIVCSVEKKCHFLQVVVLEGGELGS